MKCPNCHTNFTRESQLVVVDNDSFEKVAWFRPAPRNRLACPECGTLLKHRHSTLLIAATLGFGFLLTMSLKIVYPDSEILTRLFWLFTAAIMLCVPLLMRCGRSFRRDDDDSR